MNFILSLIIELLMMYLLIDVSVLHDTYKKFNQRGTVTYVIVFIALAINTFILANSL